MGVCPPMQGQLKAAAHWSDSALYIEYNFQVSTFHDINYEDPPATPETIILVCPSSKTKERLKHYYT